MDYFFVEFFDKFRIQVFQAMVFDIVFAKDFKIFKERLIKIKITFLNVLVSVIGTQVKDGSFFFVEAFRALGFFLKAGADVEFGFFDDGSETKIHQSHHTFFSKS